MDDTASATALRGDAFLQRRLSCPPIRSIVMPKTGRSGGMASRYWRKLGVAIMAAALAGCAAGAGEAPQAASASPAPMLADGDWPGYGRTGGQEHFSPLSAINQGNVGSLGLAWSMDLPAANSVTEPVAANGVLYFAAGLSIVHAVDAATGRELWQYDPRVGDVGGLNMRVGWGVRGLAYDNGRIFVGTQDGRLVALDANTGQPAWTAQTFNADDPAYISGAPRVFGGRVIIGFASTTGAMRGYVTAYDATSGKQLWRFWTVPGDPAKGFENDAMKMAAQTWAGEWWKFGGGGAVWNSIAWDEETDTVYLGVGSPYPWNHRIRSEGKGDNLFIDSIVALDMKTGDYRWHYQTVPADTWDFDATMDIQLAEIPVGGKVRKVVMQAPKNGFLYVLDRKTGELLSAEPIVKVTWASHVDLKTGRPVEDPQARFTVTGKQAVIQPTPLAAHNWMPMAWDQARGVVFIPTVHWEAGMGDVAGPWQPVRDRSTDGAVSFAGGPFAGMGAPTGSLLAWSPAQGRALWRVPYPTYLNGGVLATAGGLVFQGTIDGRFRAFAAESGREVWNYDTRAPLIAPPISHAAGGVQYVTVLTGMGMGFSMNAGSLIGPAVEKYGIDPATQARRVLTFAIGGTKALPPRAQPAAAPADPGFAADGKRMMAGFIGYETHCLSCHGDRAVGIGNGPDLRRSAIPLDADAFAAVVRDGALEPRGMPRFAEFDAAKVEDIRHYLRSRMAQLRGETIEDPTGSVGGVMTVR
jgi:quinohemoprotein ethanol dehydrogenase